MILVYISRTNNIERIIDQLDLKNVLRITDKNIKTELSEPFWLLTYSDGLGQVPKEVEDFLKINHRYLKAVAGSGNRNFGKNFCGAAKKIEKKYSIPLIATFELSGDQKSIENFRKVFLKAGGF